MKALQWLFKIIPTILIALVLAIIVWFSSVTASDPNEEGLIPTPIPISVIGLHPDLILSGDIPDVASVMVKAPQSVLTRLINEPNLIKITANLSGLATGEHNISPQVDIAIGPTEVLRVTPATFTISLESIQTKELPINFSMIGNLPISYEAGEPQLSMGNVQVSGPTSLVSEVTQVIATIDLTNITANVNKLVDLRALNANGAIVTGVTLSPSSVRVEIPITQLGGYRNVFIKIITTGQIAQGFYLTGIYANPPTITIYTSDPDLANNMPTFIETMPINLNGADEDFETNVALSLPEQIQVVGDQNITVQVGIAAIESSINFSNVPVQYLNLGNRLKVTLTPDVVDVYLSGPLFLLDNLNFSDIIVTLDLQNRGTGIYQLVPRIEFGNELIKVDAILPGTIEVNISQ